MKKLMTTATVFLSGLVLVACSSMGESLTSGSTSAAWGMVVTMEHRQALSL